MPDFLLRVWTEETRYGSTPYRVTAATLAEACKLLSAQCHGTGAPATSDEIQAIGNVTPPEVTNLRDGLTLIEANGGKLRDLIGLPTGASRFGEPLSAADDQRLWHSGWTNELRADRDAVDHWLPKQGPLFGNARLAIIRLTEGERAAGHDYRVLPITAMEGTAPDNFIHAAVLGHSLTGPGETLAAVL